MAESRPVWFPAPAWRETAPSTIRVAAIGDSALTVTPLGVACPICQVSAATARFAQLYAPASAGRHPEPEVTPRIRPWPAAAMMRQRGAEHVEVAVEVHVEHRTPVVLDAGGESGRAADAGDVDDRVERAELLDQLREQGADRVGVGHRDVRRPGLPAGGDDPLRGRVFGVTAPGSAVDRDAGVDGDDERAVATELLGDRGADPERTAGDDRDARACWSLRS